MRLGSRGCRRSAALLILLMACLSASSSASARPVYGFVGIWDAGDAARARELGASSARVWVRWDNVELRRGRYHWSGLDATFRALRAQGLAPLWVVTGAPPWTHPDCAGSTCPPDGRHDRAWRSFLARLAARVPHSAGIEVWNEPNLGKWFGHSSDPSRYTRLLRSAYRAIKSADAGMRVVAAGLCAGRPRGDMTQGRFLAAMYAHGARGFMDAIATHTYPGGALPVATDVRGMVDELRRVRDRARDRVPIWVSEMGQSTAGPGGYPFARFSEAEQGHRLAVMYRVLSGMADVGAVYVFRLADGGDAIGSANWGMGVLHADRTPKAAAAALLAAQTQPPWPSCRLRLSVSSRRVRPGVPITFSVEGSSSPGPTVYQLVRRRGPYSSPPLASSSGPTLRVALRGRRSYRLAVEALTADDLCRTPAVGVLVSS